VSSETYNALLHWKALLVVASSNAHNLANLISPKLRSDASVVPYVAFPLITQAIGWHFIAHAFVHKDTQLAVVFDFDQLL
jgi:hypothetical protein